MAAVDAAVDGAVLPEAGVVLAAAGVVDDTGEVAVFGVEVVLDWVGWLAAGLALDTGTSGTLTTESVVPPAVPVCTCGVPATVFDGPPLPKRLKKGRNVPGASFLFTWKPAGEMLRYFLMADGGTHS